ncbi:MULTISPECIES: hypothetical protein [Mycobacterium]|uniref:Secreted protein n=1 Tax=Mycobacterium kiyosense TaxID=2871094 RepID=A0A9P3Q7H4_9MYCO|nr:MULTISPECIES: hypothetical protein [Mycobacterium]BDE14713.1 hypothetical protein MKCMC460_35730 [Mycobacterium sp. 20KCMC460]GLB81398.1 hypothetical protein SRL2020028_06540 [Mycobacterium kiyosense]GLB90949.1 hypothetical protein SRL2020130_37660 [Mycobacterium kiyosense]GLB97189.1 hypothetical protein SRL2020226_39650 [Mycobacterium kiyosense]GLC03559.1 hypothetical protein SRL2020400_41500 [Mycobacterium kiyosense]
MRSSIFVWLSVVAALPVFAPTAAADPDQFPSLSYYGAVNTADYQNYSAYMTSGVQFATPTGYRCRMMFVHKQNGAYMSCWGSLPGTEYNHVGLVYAPGVSKDAAVFSNVDLSAMDAIPSGPGVTGRSLTAQDYKLLPIHSKIVYTDGPLQTCGVDQTMTACELVDGEQKHGFVISPQGSWVF